MKTGKVKLVIAAPIVIIVVALLYILIRALMPHPVIVTGMAEATEVDVSSKIPGRLDSVFVSEGTRVEKGQLLATLTSREIDAKVEQARGAMEAAKAKWDMALNGARPQERDATEKQYLQAKHQYELAEKTWNRVQDIYRDSVISAQEHDEVEFKYKAAREQLDAAKAKYDLVLSGARAEEIRAAEGLFHQAENAYKEALSYQQECRLTSPLAGEVSKRISDPGEIVAAGYPVFTVLDPSDVWVVLQLREDQMTGVKMDRTFKAVVPALGKESREFRVSYIAPMADFATWRATNQKGDFDLKTFEVRARPASPLDGLRPGMTVRVEL